MSLQTKAKLMINPTIVDATVLIFNTSKL